ncbi:GTP-binding protein [Lapidilactobacillus salsurivasis]
MTQIVAGIVAHVDAGKTTLSEALLYQAGALRQLGRVDKGDAFLDSDALEKQRGITIFSHQALLQYQDLALTLVDTPGHVDFATQTEQVLSILDYAILVVSATEGIQGHTRTLWRLLARYQVPTFIFVNKSDLTGADPAGVLQQLQTELAEGCLDFRLTAQGELSSSTQEALALANETLLDDFLATGRVPDAAVRGLIKQRQVIPCYFGAALKMTGVAGLLAGLARWTDTKYAAAKTADTAATPADFGARVFKISHDDNGERLTWVRVLSGSLPAKTVLLGTEKANQLRRYNGAKYTVVAALQTGEVGAIAGLTTTFPGQGLGGVTTQIRPALRPVLTYAVQPQAADPHACLVALRQLEDEDPQLHVTWSPQLQEIRVRLMGAVQLEVLQQLLAERYQLAVSFDAGQILYQETITAAVEGVGHFEPLRHYAEVHLLLQPGARGSGLTFKSTCPLDVLGRNWQHQVATNLFAKEQLGVLSGAPLTDVQITLVAGRASNVHSVGGDFREATWRALRQGLMMLKQQGACQILEPWYQFRLELAGAQIGRALNDLQQMHAEVDPLTTAKITAADARTILTGAAPVATMQNYAQAVNAYTHGQGQLSCTLAGYRPCHDSAAVLAAQSYEPVADLDNTPDSVFCAHGAGYPVAWDQVPAAAHLAYQTDLLQ